MKKLFILMIFLPILFSGCSTHKQPNLEQPVQNKTDNKISIKQISQLEADSVLRRFSKNLDVRYDDMKNITFYSCPVDLENHPHIFLIPYVIMTNDYKVVLKNHILYSGSEPLYFDTLYIKSDGGVAKFLFKNIIKSSAGEEFIGAMQFDLYKKLCESVEGENIKIRLEGRTFGERNLTAVEIVQIDSVLSIYDYDSVLSIYDYFSHVQVIK